MKVLYHVVFCELVRLRSLRLRQHKYLYDILFELMIFIENYFRTYNVVKFVVMTTIVYVSSPFYFVVVVSTYNGRIFIQE